jgi:hypothetical protein
MGKIVLTVLGWVASKVGLLIIVLLMFIAGTYLKNEFDKLDQVWKDQQRGTKIFADTDSINIAKSLPHVLGGELPSAQASLTEITHTRDKLRSVRNSKKAERDKIENDASLIELKNPVSASSLKLLKLEVDIEILDQADRHISRVEARARDISSCVRTPKVSCEYQVRQLQGQVLQHDANINAWNNQIRDIRTQYPNIASWCATYGGNTIGTLPCRQILVHEQAVTLAQDQLGQASKRISLLKLAEKTANEPFSLVTSMSLPEMDEMLSTLAALSKRLRTSATVLPSLALLAALSTAWYSIIVGTAWASTTPAAAKKPATSSKLMREMPRCLKLNVFAIAYLHSIK